MGALRDFNAKAMESPKLTSTFIMPIQVIPMTEFSQSSAETWFSRLETASPKFPDANVTCRMSSGRPNGETYRAGRPEEYTQCEIACQSHRNFAQNTRRSGLVFLAEEADQSWMSLNAQGIFVVNPFVFIISGYQP